MRTLIIKKGGNDMLKEFMEQVLAKLDQNQENFERAGEYDLYSPVGGACGAAVCGEHLLE